MKNEIRRKLTSLTLMTIMFAGGMTFAIPGVMPQAVAQTGTLSVSAVNGLTGDTFGGPQVIEIVIDDDGKDDVDALLGVPSVKIDDKTVMMVQADSGLWYAYVAELNDVQHAEANGITFGGDIKAGLNDDNRAKSGAAEIRSVNATHPLSALSEPEEVLSRVSDGTTTFRGQVLVTADYSKWPFIQLYDFDDEDTIDIEYGDETVTLTYQQDLSEYAELSLDRNEVPTGAQIHMTLNDFRLNLDPTSKDTWIVPVGDEMKPKYGDKEVTIFEDNTYGNNVLLSHEAELGSQYDARITYNDTSGNPMAIPTDSGSAFGFGIIGVDTGLEAIAVTTTHPGVLDSEAQKDANDPVFHNHYVALHDRPDNAACPALEVRDITWQEPGDVDIEGTMATMTKVPYAFEGTHSLTEEDIRFMADANVGRVVSFTINPVNATGHTSTTDIAAVCINNVESVADYTVYNQYELQVELNMITFEETASNSGVFVSYDSSDNSPIALSSDVAISADFDIIYADNDDPSVTVLDEDHDITMVGESVDGTWNAGEAITVRLEAPNLDLNTRVDETLDVAPKVPVIKIGDPITLHDLGIDDLEANRDSGVATINSPANYTATIDSDRYDEIKDLKNYANYYLPDGVMLKVDALGLDIQQPGSGLTPIDIPDTQTFNLNFTGDKAGANVVFDIFTFGVVDSETVENNAIYRILMEEKSPGVFEGTAEYSMLNQMTVDDDSTYSDLTTIDEEVVIVLDTGYTGTDGVQAEYDDDTTRYDAPSHTASLTLDQTSYSINEEVTITITDADLDENRYRVTEGFAGINTASTHDAVDPLLVIEIGGEEWNATCDGVTEAIPADFVLEGADGAYTATFDIPQMHCVPDTENADDDSTTTHIAALTAGKSLKVTYHDFRDTDGNNVELSTSASIRANTGSVSLDREEYPLPASGDDEVPEWLRNSVVTVHVEVTDPDFDTSDGKDSIEVEGAGPVTLEIEGTVVATIGGTEGTYNGIEDMGELVETDDQSGVFSGSIEIPITIAGHTVLQGHIITVQYTDPTGANGEEEVGDGDSATFNPKSAVLRVDKSEYVVGETAVLTLVENDLNLNSDDRETLEARIIAWEGSEDASLDAREFETTVFRETADGSGIFQTEFTIPVEVADEAVERGERVTLKYVDPTPSGGDSVGEESRDITTTFTISKAGASLSIDKETYSWRDKINIRVVSVDDNIESQVRDTIQIDITGQTDSLKDYNLRETTSNSGVFVGEVTLAGFEYGPIEQTIDADGNGPTDGVLPVENEEGLTVSFEYSEDDPDLLATALVRWNVAEVRWLEDSYRLGTVGTIEIVEPDLNLNPEAFDNFDVTVRSETFIGGVKITVTETDEDSSIFVGNVEFDDLRTTGNRLHATDGDVITAVYDDQTLPPPNDAGDEFTITATTVIGANVPPLERMKVSGLAMVDAQGNLLESVSAGQQVSISADLMSAMPTTQQFTYILQIQDESGVTTQLSWVSSKLDAAATTSAAQSWLPTEPGSYTVTVFVWESINNPTALSPQSTLQIDVT